MDPNDSPDVLEEVEALFKKLQHLPESVRLKALSCIQEKLPETQSSKNVEDKGSPKTPSVNKKKGASPHKDGPQEEAHKEVLVKEKLRKDSSCAVASKTELDQEKLKTESSTEVSGIEDSTQNEDLHDAARHEKNVSNKNIKKENQQSKNRKSQDKARLPFRLRVKKDVQDSSPDEQASDDETPVFVIEDVKTLHGRRTKRINAANLIKGIRRTKVVPSSAVKLPVSKVSSKEAAIEKKPPSSQMKNIPVPSDVAESAEILASLSNEISQKDSTQVNVGVEQMDCLKDKTNNQDCEVAQSTTNDSSEPETQNINIKLEHEILMDASPPADEGNEGDSEPNDLAVEEDTDGTENDFSCHFCQFKSATKSALAAHVRKHKENIPKAPYTCSECNKTFSQSCGLQLHMKRHRGERDYPCSHCDYKAFTKVDLSRHQTIHTGERNKICEFCGKAFAKDSTLRDHVKAIHERKVTHACEICGFVTHRANNLRVHIRMRHHGEYNNHVCPVCGASVKQKNAFLEHMRSHTGERPYKCQECSASFACLARLNVHRNAVHGERLFKCGDCNKSFQTKHHLLRHHAIHTKERPYACPFCSYACNTQGNIAKHVRSIHNCPDFSYRKYKSMQENGGQEREVDPEWVRKGEEVTKEYLNSLSEKMGRPITLDELWTKEKEMQKKKEEQEKARLALKEQKAARAEAAGVAFMSKVKKRRAEEKRSIPKKGKQDQSESAQDDLDDPAAIMILENETDGEEALSSTEMPFYKLVSQAGGNIQLCLETDEVQVYTGDATRELSLMQMKNDDSLSVSDGIQTIQGYMNEHGQFVRLDEGDMVNEDSSTVVVIIDSDMNEGITPEVADVMEISCEEPGEASEVDERKRSLEIDPLSNQESKRKKSVIRVIKQEN